MVHNDKITSIAVCSSLSWYTEYIQPSADPSVAKYLRFAINLSLGDGQ